MTDEELQNRTRYSHWTPVTLRYGDTDSLGHINNAVFTTLLESGRARLLFNRDGAITGRGTTFVIVHLSVNFIGEMHYPGTVEVGTALDAWGRTSLKLVQAMFKDGICCSTARSTIVLIDEKTRRSTPITDGIKRLIEAQLAEGQPV